MKTHLVKRKVSTGAFDFLKTEDAKGGMLRQKSKIIQGIDREISQKINKIIDQICNKYGFSYYIPPHNPGEMIIQYEKL